MKLSTLAEWLSWINSIHNTEIDLGLERVKAVADKLVISKPKCPVIIVGGTNGKGSTVAGLEAIYAEAGYQVGTFTSPILFKHNEQVRINGTLATDEEFCWAFAQVEAARGSISLTSFEFFTLAALLLFQAKSLDVWILEVGLGGRLDAVNILDADLAVITSIGIDHVNWLGSTREKIALEKAGILRAKQLAVCGDSHPPITLLNHASSLGTILFCQDQHFTFREHASDWTWECHLPAPLNLNQVYDHLPLNSLLNQNMSTVLMAITLLQDRLPVSKTCIDLGLTKVKLTGRIEIIPGKVVEIYDVAHNPDAVSLLATKLKDLPLQGKTHAVFSMLEDKDIQTCVNVIRDQIDFWYIGELATPRAATEDELIKLFDTSKVANTTFFSNITEAYKFAKTVAEEGDRIVIFGSFHTVSEVLEEKR